MEPHAITGRPEATGEDRGNPQIEPAPISLAM